MQLPAVCSIIWSILYTISLAFAFRGEINMVYIGSKEVSSEIGKLFKSRMIFLTNIQFGHIFIGKISKSTVFHFKFIKPYIKKAENIHWNM